MFRHIETFSPLEVHLQVDHPSEQGLKQHFEYVSARMRSRRLYPDQRRFIYVIQVNGGQFRQANAAERNLLAQWIKSEFELMQATSLGLSFVIESTLIRGALTAVFWLTKTPMPHRVHATLEDAFNTAVRELAAANLSIPEALANEGVSRLQIEIAKASTALRAAKL